MAENAGSGASRSTEAKGREVFEKFRRGLLAGEWKGFTDLLTDDFTFCFPQGKWRGEHRGKEKALEFFRYVTSVFPRGITVTSIDHVLVSGDTVMLEFKDEGEMVLQGALPRPYRNRVAIAFDFRGEQVSGYREYFGSDGSAD